MNNISWDKAIKALFDYRCAICGDTNKLESHHIKPRHIYPELATDINNGICLCHVCHYYFHNGKYNSPVNSNTWQGIQIPDMKRYRQVKEFRNKLQTTTE